MQSIVEKIKNRQLRRIMEKEKKLLKKYVKIMPVSYKKYLASFYPDAVIRRLYLEDMGVEFQENSYANIGFMKIPNICSQNKVVIGKNVSIAPNVLCICEANANNGKEINTFSYVTERASRNGDIHIEDEAWIGANVTILPGITIGRCAIVGAGSVVTKNLEPYGVYIGVPAKKVRDVRE